MWRDKEYQYHAARVAPPALLSSIRKTDPIVANVGRCAQEFFGPAPYEPFLFPGGSCPTLAVGRSRVLPNGCSIAPQASDQDDGRIRSYSGSQPSGPPEQPGSSHPSSSVAPWGHKPSSSLVRASTSSSSSSSYTSTMTMSRSVTRPPTSALPSNAHPVTGRTAQDPTSAAMGAGSGYICLVFSSRDSR